MSAPPTAGGRKLWADARVAISLAMRASPAALLVAAAVSIAVSLLPVTAAWLTKLLLDHLAQPPIDVSQVLGYAAGLVATGVTAAAVPQVTQYLRTQSARKTAALALEQLYVAVERFVGLRRFEDPAFLNRLRLARNTGATTPGALFDGAASFVGGSLSLVGFLASLIILSPMMAGLAMLSAIPVLFAQLSLARRRAAMMWSVGSAERKELFYAELLSDVGAAKEIRLFGLGSFLRERMMTERRISDRAERQTDRRALAVNAGLGLLSAAVAGAGLTWAVFQAAGGRLSVGDVSMFVAAVAGVQAALSQLAGAAGGVHHSLLLFGHYADVVSSEPDLPAPRAPQALPELRRGIELRDVWFRYSDDHPWVLRGVNLHIPHGTALALVGRNGSGKSTIVKLLCRMYDPTRGQILWDGVDLRDVPADKLRRRISAVFQDFTHYDMSAAENIGLGDVSAIDDRERVEAAARRAGVHETLSVLPRGYDTLLSRIFFGGDDPNDPQTGVQLSGGQWQRVALARSLLRDRRDLLICDEPSAGLDAEAEYEVHNTLRDHRRGLTSLLISHRLGTVRDAARIVVLADGVIAEEGSHDELLASDGAYARMFTLQAHGYEATRSEEILSAPPVPVGAVGGPRGLRRRI